MPTIDEAKAQCRFVSESGGVRGAPALPPDFAKCGGSRRVVEAPPRRRLSMRSQLARRPLSRCAAETAAFHAAVAGRPPWAARRDTSPHREMARKETNE